MDIYICRGIRQINQSRWYNQACKLLLSKIEDNIEELKNMFTEDAIKGFNDNDLAWILFVDGRGGPKNQKLN